MPNGNWTTPVHYQLFTKQKNLKRPYSSDQFVLNHHITESVVIVKQNENFLS